MDVDNTTAVVWAVEFPGDGDGEGLHMLPFVFPVTLATAHLKVVGLWYAYTGSRELPTGTSIAPMDDILDELGDSTP